MKTWNIAQKISSLFIFLLVIALVSVGTIGYWSVQQTMRATLDTTLRSQAELVSELIDELSFKALQVATVVAQLRDVKAAYRDTDETAGRAQLKDAVNPISDALATAAEIDQYRIHFHKPPAVSFYRTWTDRAGDDLSAFRNTVLSISSTHEAIRTVELGRGGFVIRGIAPIIDNGEYLGSVEVYFPPGDIVPFLDSEMRAGTVLLVNASAAKNLIFEEDYAQYFKGEVGESLVSEISDDWIVPEELIDPAILSGVVTEDDLAISVHGVYQIAYIPLKDFSGEVNGHMISIIDASQFTELVRSQMIKLGIVVLLLALVGGLLVMLFARTVIAAPLTMTTDNLKAIAMGDADLTVRLPEARKDEIGRLARHFNNFVGNLQEIVTNIKDAESRMQETAKGLDRSTETTRSAAGEIANVANRVGEKVHRQNDSVTQSSSSVEQITGNIKSLESMIVNLSTAISDSSAAVEEMTANIASISRNLEKVDDYVGRLETASDRGRTTLKGVITRITEVVAQAENLQKANQLIATISAQTNLLAMNAAIEAAHAGDYGRGFAVVADEIRNLAENSTRQSRIISQELKSTRQAIENVVQASEEADSAFGSMQEMVSTVSDLERNVKMALTAQDEGNQAVLGNLEQMKSIGGQVEGGVSEISEGSNIILEEMGHLVETSQDLTSMVDEINNGILAIQSAMDLVMTAGNKNRELMEQVEHETGRFKT